MAHEVALLEPWLKSAIEAAIKNSAPAWAQFVQANQMAAFEGDQRRLPLVMKYVPSSRAADFLPKFPKRKKGQFPPPNPKPFPPPIKLPKRPPTKGMFIGSKDYTWGKAVYVTGITEPLSTATYGRVGIVSYFDPSKIQKVFDARDETNFRLYLEWLHRQPVYPRALLTVHTNHWLHGLRNDFRTQFKIDVVMCNADETDVGLWYTDPSDTWLCVSDFEQDQNDPTQYRLKDKFSKIFPDVRLTVVIEDEFITPDPNDPKTRPPAWPQARARQLAISRQPPLAPSAQDIATAYWQGRILRVPS